MSQMKTGFIYEEPAPEDYVFGADQSLATKFAGRQPLNSDGDWSKYLPTTEHQAPDYETNACVSFATLSIIEMLRKRLDDLDQNLSDRFVAKLSNTDPNSGNTPKRVADTIRKNWSVFEEEYPRPPTVQEFYAEIPKKLIALATGRGAEYAFGYELIQPQDMREALQYSPLGISVPAWWKDETGRYFRPEGQWDTHWTVCYALQPNGDMLVFDSYPPFLKVVRADVIPRTIFGYHLTKQVNDYNAWAQFLSWLKYSLDSLGRSLGLSQKS